MKNIIEKCKTTKILAIIGVAGLILGTMMPYLSYNILGYKYSISLWGYWEGKVVMILAIANLLFIFKDVVEKYVPFLFDTGIGRSVKNLDNPKFSLVPTILIAIFVFITTINLGVESFKHYSIGFYILWIGTIFLVAYAVLYKKEDKYMNNIKE